MSEKLFWRSALKAIFLALLLSTPVVLLVEFLFLGDAAFEASHEAVGAFRTFLLLILLSAAFFVWVLYAYFDRLLPAWKTMAKALLFNLIGSAIFYPMYYVFFPEISKTQLLLKTTGIAGWLLYEIVLLLVTTALFAYFFDRFKGEEERETLGKPDYKVAPLRLRALAFLLDFLILSAFAISAFSTLPLKSVTPTLSMDAKIVFLAVILLHVAYWVFMEGKFGASIGKAIVGIRVVRENGSKIGYGKALSRNLWKFMPFFSPIIGLPDVLPALFSEKKQRFLDKFLRTVVIMANPKKRA